MRGCETSCPDGKFGQKLIFGCWLCRGPNRISYEFAKAEAARNPISLLPRLDSRGSGGGGITCALISGKLRRSGVAWSLFIARSFDVDAAIITLSGLPKDAVAALIGAFAIGGMVAVNMAF